MIIKKNNCEMMPLSMSISQKLESKLTHQQTMIENSPESDKFKKHCSILVKYYSNFSTQDKTVTDLELMTSLSHLKLWSKKTKYQLKILDSQLIQRVLIPMMYFKGNIDNASNISKVIMNVVKNKNNHYKLVPEDKIMKELLNLLILYLNSNLTSYILKILFHLTENKDFMIRLKKLESEDTNLFLYPMDKEKQGDIRNLKRVDLGGFSRVFSEMILDDLSSSNKILLLKMIYNIYSVDSIYMHPDSLEPILRCLNSKDPETTLPALKIILMYATDKSYHIQLINTNFIFRLVKIYKQGIVDLDVILVQILLIFFGNESLHEVLFENNILMILENYLLSFDNDQNEELIKNVFEIFKEIIKITDRKIKNPLITDKKLQIAVFTKALGMATSTKKESSILSCLSTINMMLNEFSENLINEEHHVKKIIELMPSFFKSKDVEIVKYSLAIFEAVLSKKQEYFEENYVKSNDKTFNLKYLIHNVINLINELFGNFEVISKSCSILITLSDIGSIHNYFLQEPQITIIRMFNDDLITEKIKLIKEFEKLCAKKIKDNIKQFSIEKAEKNKDSSFSSNANGSLKSPDFVLDKPKKHKDESMKKEEEQKRELEKKLLDNKEILKSSIQIVANLTKYSENLEILTNKGFLDIINKMLIIHNFDALPHIVKCIQGFCCSSTSISIILNCDMMSKILKLFHKYRDNSSIFTDKLADKSALFLKYIGNSHGRSLLGNNQLNEEQLIYEKASSKLEVLLCLRNIVESDIKLQRQFIVDEGVQILLSDVTDRAYKISDKSIDQLNSVILKVMYVISCNINKLYIVFNKGDMEIDDLLESEENSENSFSNSPSELSQPSLKESRSGKDSEVSSSNNRGKSSFFILGRYGKRGNLSPMEIFKRELSQTIFMEKLLSIGFFDITSIGTYKDLMKILINLYLNRYYLKYFTTDDVFQKVMEIIEKILSKYMKRSESNYDIIKLILIFLKFISEEENLIKRFLDSSVISNILNIINTNEFAETIQKEELEQFYYNTSLVLLRLTEFKGHTHKFDFLKNFFNILENLYDINFMNGKIYIINIIKNILTEKEDFFEENSIVPFINKIVFQANSFVIYEFVELLKILVHNRSICRRMENVFKYLINEIKNVSYSNKFKKRILELILCLSYENNNIKDFALHDLLLLIKNLDININQKTTLLILMNFSSVSSNFSYLQTNHQQMNKKELNDSTQNMIEQIDGMSIKKKDLINIIDQLLNSDRFSQILIQRLMINLTSIENLDYSIIPEKVINVLIQIINTSRRMQDSIVIFSLCILVNVTNRNILMNELKYEEDDQKADDLSMVENLKDSEDSSIIDTKNRKDNVKKDINIVDYILEQVPDILRIINDLFERNNMDITSLVIMLACNLSRKLKLSVFFGLDKKITQCVESHFIKTFSKKVLDTNSGKFFVIAILKYCICLSGDEKRIHDHLKFFEAALGLQIEPVNEIKIPMEKPGILKKTNSLQFNFSNLMRDLNMTQKIVRIVLKKEDLINNTVDFALLQSQIKFIDAILTLQQNNPIFQSDIFILTAHFYIEFIFELSNLLNSDIQGNIKLEEHLQNLLFSIFNVLIIFMKNQTFAMKTIINPLIQLTFYLVSTDPSKFTDDLKSIFVYTVFCMINKGYENSELKNNNDVKKWLIKLFKLGNNSEQTDYYCLKIFTQTVQNNNLTDIFWKSNKFIKKLASYLSKQDIEDEKLKIMKKEAEKILNIISFNSNSHKKLYELGIYNYFKAKTYFKNPKESLIQREDTIFIVNMILNKENGQFIKEDIISLLKQILVCKSLWNNVKIKLFEIFLMYTLEGVVKIFKEDYLIIFNILYDNIKNNFSDMIILVDNFTKKKKYEAFCKMLSSDDNIIIKIYQDFLEFDKNFPSHLEELNCFFKLLEIFTTNSLTPRLEEIVIDIIKKMMQNKVALNDINILNSVLGFVLYFFSQNSNNDKSDLSDVETNKGNKTKNSGEVIKSMKKFMIKELIDIIVKECITNDNLIHSYILTTMICQEEYKHVLECFKTINSLLFSKDFLMLFIRALKKMETLEIKELVYVINLASVFQSYCPIPQIEEFLDGCIEIYEQFFTSNIEEDVITSLYFFCELIKLLELSKSFFNRFLKFIINYIANPIMTDTQKEVLIKYYNEILSRFKITTLDDLNTIFTFFLKIHYDKTLSFIEFLIMGTIINNSTVDVITKNLESYFQMISLMMSTKVDDNKFSEFLNYIKLILFNIKAMSGKDVDNQNILLQDLKQFFFKFIKIYDEEIRSNDKFREIVEKIMSKIDAKI